MRIAEKKMPTAREKMKKVHLSALLVEKENGPARREDGVNMQRHRPENDTPAVDSSFSHKSPNLPAPQMAWEGGAGEHSSAIKRKEPSSHTS
jgi:hypothetical protein